MFGYILPQKPELRVREWYAYRAYYCGLCKELGRQYGPLSRMFLNYDMVLPAILSDSLSGYEATACPQRCMANPFEKRPMCGATPGLSLAADALVLTVWYKLQDDIADERFAKRLPSRTLQVFLRRAYQKAASRQPQLDKVLAEQMQAQAALEGRRSTSADEAADPTARMTAAVFAAAGPHAPAMERMGLLLGKCIYYLDAAEDFDKDRASGAYNVFALQGLDKTGAVDAARQMCRLCAGEAARSYNQLTLLREKGLLDNIIFLGLPQSIALAGEKRTKPRARE